MHTGAVDPLFQYCDSVQNSIYTFFEVNAPVTSDLTPAPLALNPVELVDPESTSQNSVPDSFIKLPTVLVLQLHPGSKKLAKV
jgi:hypothetical protein